MKVPSSILLIASAASALCILVGAPTLAMESDRNGYSGKDHYVTVCVQKKDVTCYRVPYNNPDLVRFTQRHESSIVKKSKITLHLMYSLILVWLIFMCAAYVCLKRTRSFI